MRFLPASFRSRLKQGTDGQPDDGHQHLMPRPMGVGHNKKIVEDKENCE